MTTTEPTINGQKRPLSGVPSQALPVGSDRQGTVAPSDFAPQFESVDQAALAVLEAQQLGRHHGDLITARRQVLDQGEFDADTAVEQQLRARQREARLRLGLVHIDAETAAEEARLKTEATQLQARVKSEAARAKTRAKLDDQDDKEKITLRRALRKQRKLIDGAARLTSVYVRYRLVWVSLCFAGAAVALWNTYSVAHALGGANPNPIFYIVEPPFALTLASIVIGQITSAEGGRLKKPFSVVTDRTGRRRLRVTMAGWLESFALLGTLLLCTLPAVGTRFDGEFFVSRIFPPILLVVVMLSLLVAAETFGPMIRDAWVVQAEDEENARKRTQRAAALSRQVHIAMQDKEAPIPLQPDTGLPSVSEIMRRYPSEKLVAQCAWDLLAHEREVLQK